MNSATSIAVHRAATLIVAALGLAACAPPPPPPPAPVADAEQTALALEDHTGLREPIRIVFTWRLNEAGMRLHGRGVARIEPPYKARLDLFLGNGETVVRAAMVGEDLRLPPGAPRNILPPPDLMWGVLGVFRPDSATALVGGEASPDRSLQLRYVYPDGRELRYTVEAGRVRRVERLDGSGRVVERVVLELEDASRYPVAATYRNVSAFRELKITRESVERVEPYPPDIWYLAR